MRRLKEDMAREICVKLSAVYKMDSHLSKQTGRALVKMTYAELSGMLVMVQTSLPYGSNQDYK